MPTALDYSGGRPAAAAVKAAQHIGVVRYAGTPGRKKNITRAEYQDMDRQGIGVALVFEDAAGDALKGRPRGVTAAQAIVADAAAIGFPTSRPLYFAVDQDITGQMSTVLDYFRGIGSVLGGRPVGVYGEADVLDAVMGAGLARYGWQTVAWSRGRTAKTRHLFQRAGQTFVGGVQVDINDVLAADWGQHNTTTEVPDMDTNQDQLLREIHVELTGSAAPIYPAAGYASLRAVVKGLTDSVGQLTALVSRQSGTSPAELAAALLPGLIPIVKDAVAGVDDDNPEEFAQAVVDKLGDVLHADGGAQ